MRDRDRESVPDAGKRSITRIIASCRERRRLGDHKDGSRVAAIRRRLPLIGRPVIKRIRIDQV